MINIFMHIKHIVKVWFIVLKYTEYRQVTWKIDSEEKELILYNYRSLKYIV